jgi:hypothetical protein
VVSPDFEKLAQAISRRISERFIAASRKFREVGFGQDRNYLNRPPLRFHSSISKNRLAFFFLKE